MIKQGTISQETIDYAREKLSRVSIDSDKGLSKFGSEENRILVGFIGERIVMKYLGIENDSDDYDYDLTYNGKKLEVKTISCKFKPLPHYLCTVNSHDLDGVHKQDADYYIFLRIKNDFTKGWILGYLPCDEFFKKGEYVEKGKDFGKFQFVKANATVIEISQLLDIEKLKLC